MPFTDPFNIFFRGGKKGGKEEEESTKKTGIEPTKQELYIPASSFFGHLKLTEEKWVQKTSKKTNEQPTTIYYGFYGWELKYKMEKQKKKKYIQK